MIVEKLEKMVNEMAEKIVTLELKVKEIESKEDVKANEAAKKVEDPKEVIKKKDSSNDSQVKESKDKVFIFKFGDTAQKSISGATNVQEKDKSGKYVKCEL